MGNRMSQNRKPAIRCAVLMLALFGGSVCAQAGQTLITGFEDLNLVPTANGDLSAVKAGQGVTEGKQAAQMPAEAVMTLDVSGDDLATNDWIRLDTLTTQLLPHSLKLELVYADGSHGKVGVVQAGKDTLSLPVSVIAASFGGSLPRGAAVLRITNTGKAPLIIDNLRLETAAAAPDGAVLLDFGPSGQVVWPGFEAAGSGSNQVIWSGEARVYAYAETFPDPLGRDFIGRPPRAKVLDHCDLRPPGGKEAVAWAWVSHYGSRAGTQPTEYIMKVNGKTVLQERRSAREMLGSEGLMMGYEGEWTPEWFSEKYAEQFVELVDFRLRADRNRVELGNCQLSAVAMAPEASKTEMAKYVKRVREDLRRYRRQFIAGQRVDPVCRLQPTAEETQAGFMSFLVDDDDGFVAGWQPKNIDRVTRLKGVAVNGSLVVFRLAVAPLKKSAYTGGRMGPLRSKTTGRPMAVNNLRSGVYAVKPVPRVTSGLVLFQPFILDKRQTPVEPKEMVFITAVLPVSESAAEGVYEGQLLLSFSGGKVEIPVEIEVHQLAAGCATPTFGAYTDAEIGQVYHALASTLSDSQRGAFTARLRKTLLDTGINALKFTGPRPGEGTAVHDDALINDLKRVSTRDIPGMNLVDFSGFFWRLGRGGTMVTSQRHRGATRNAASRTKAILGKVRLDEAPMLVGLLRRERDLGGFCQQAAQIASGGGKPALTVSASILGQGDNATKAAKSFSAWIVIPDSDSLASSLDRLHKAGDDRKALIYSGRPDRLTVGLYAAGIGADGAYLSGMFPGGVSPWKGDTLDGRGMIVPEPGRPGSFLPTLQMLRFWEGVDDYMLVKRCEALLAKGSAAKVQVTELKTALEDLRTDVAKLEGLGFDLLRMRSDAISPGGIASHRLTLMQAADAVSDRIDKR